MKIILSLLILTACLACGGGHGHGHEDASTDSLTVEERRLTKEYGSAYVCPMHCKGSGSDQPGKCPVCGMDYVANTDIHEDHDREGHDHN